MKACFINSSSTIAQPVQYRTISEEDLQKALEIPLGVAHPSQSYADLALVVKSGNREAHQALILLTRDKLVTQYKSAKTADTNPVWIFQEDNFPNCCYCYELSYGVDNWFAENVTMPILTLIAADSAQPVSVMAGSFVQLLLYDVLRMSDTAFNDALPHLLNVRLIIQGSAKTSLDLFIILSEGDMPNRLLQYFRAGGAVASHYWDEDQWVNTPPVTVANNGVRDLLWNLGIRGHSGIEPNNIYFGFSTQQAAVTDVRKAMGIWRGVAEALSVSSIFCINRVLFTNELKNKIYCLISILKADAQDFRNIDKDPDNARWHGAFHFYNSPCDFEINISCINSSNAIYIAAFVHRQLALVKDARKANIDCLESLHRVIKHVALEVFPALSGFEQKFSLLTFLPSELLNDWERSDYFTQYLNAEDLISINEFHFGIINLLPTKLPDYEVVNVSSLRFFDH